MAVVWLKELNGYKDSKTKMREAEYAYVKTHKNSTDKTTYSYLKDLKAAGYSDSRKIYNELYKWTLTFTAVNSSENSTTNKSSISRYDPVYFHYKISGGEPEGSTKITFKWTNPEGRTGSYVSKDKYYNGETGWYGWSNGIYKNPEYGGTGTLIVKAYDGNGNLIGTGSVKIGY